MLCHGRRRVLYRIAFEKSVMKKCVVAAVTGVLCACIARAAEEGGARQADWPQWRGPAATGADHEGQSFIAAFDTATGHEVWRAERDEVTSWSTPLVVEHGGRRQAVVSATRRIRGYDAVAGKLVWEAAGMTANAIPSPAAGSGIVFCMYCLGRK